jgi:hypothetical protein
MQKPQRIILLMVFVLSAVGAFWWRMSLEPAVMPTADLVVTVTPTPSTTQPETANQGTSKIAFHTLTATAAATKALDLAQSQLELQLKEYDFGLMVEGVNGLLADTNNYWAVYLNGEYAKVGIAELVLQAGDRLELRYETISL